MKRPDYRLGLLNIVIGSLTRRSVINSTTSPEFPA